MGLNLGVNLKTLLQPHYSLLCVVGVLVVVCVLTCLVCVPLFLFCGVKAVILKLPF